MGESVTEVIARRDESAALRVQNSRKFTCVRALLACGCTVKLRNWPMEGRGLMCRSGAGHGYGKHAWLWFETEAGVRYEPGQRKNLS